MTAAYKYLTNHLSKFAGKLRHGEDGVFTLNNDRHGDTQYHRTHQYIAGGAGTDRVPAQRQDWHTYSKWCAQLPFCSLSFSLTLMKEMELKKLHMGTMSYGADSMDEVAHQLALAFGISAEQGKHFAYLYRISS